VSRSQLSSILVFSRAHSDNSLLSATMGGVLRLWGKGVLIELGRFGLASIWAKFEAGQSIWWFIAVLTFFRGSQ